MFVKATLITVLVFCLHQGGDVVVKPIMLSCPGPQLVNLKLDRKNSRSARCGKGDALHCYECNSGSNPQCKDNVTTLEMTEFPEFQSLISYIFASPTCIKYVFKFSSGYITFRGCGLRHTFLINTCENYKATPNKKFLSYDLCDTDGCNGSSALAPSAVLFFLVAVLATL